MAILWLLDFHLPLLTLLLPHIFQLPGDSWGLIKSDMVRATHPGLVLDMSIHEIHIHHSFRDISD